MKKRNKSSEDICEKCSAKLFKVVPLKTTQQEIIEFARKTVGWRDNPDALEGWMPSGVYCPNGCVNIHVDFPAPWPPEEIVEDHTEYGLFIKSPGPRRLDVMKALRKRLLLSPADSKKAIDILGICVVKGRKAELGELVEELERLGAIVELRVHRGESVLSPEASKDTVRDEETEGVSWAIIVIPILLMLLVVVLSFIYTAVIWLKVGVNVIILLLGMAIISSTGNFFARKISSGRAVLLSPLAGIAVFTVIGGVLSIFWGWSSTIVVLLFFSVLVIIDIFRSLSEERL